ncbi:DUF6090 family protein [Portibacter marinus]|uniref:DUF6090 family protein n=1 Tax=Portibacter marinus TaxID=2898660 RepID=UPI001F488E57|nr:DUF6090 family protein [Portibacter marinus]
MLRFFRKIRVKLLAEGRAGKYLIYAIGEIVLVVIGILIALWLNNWNTARKDGDKELSLLAEMKQNLVDDLVDCRYNININQQLHKGSKVVLRHLEERTTFHDSLRLSYGGLWGATSQLMNTSAYDNLSSIGFDLVQNDSLRRNITKLYSERYPYIERIETNFETKIQMNEVLPQVNAKIVIDTMWVSGYPLDLKALQSDYAFHGLLRNIVFSKNFMVGRYQQLEKQLEDLIEQIDTELKNRNS